MLYGSIRAAIIGLMTRQTEQWPAMIAAVTDLAGKITGAHRTWLSRDGGSDKAPIETQRKAMGDLLGHAVRFGMPAM